MCDIETRTLVLIPMVIWLASYPRSGNTFVRVLLHSLFGFETHSSYSVANDARNMPGDVSKLMSLVGQTELTCDINKLRTDPGRHFVKTHDLPGEDDFPSLVLVRDGRDAAVSYAHFILKTEELIGPPGNRFERTLRDVIRGDRFGGWSRSVNAWANRVGWDRIVRYEEVIRDPVRTLVTALTRIGGDWELNDTTFPSFRELHDMVPWFFRRGKPGSWCNEMPSHLQELFMEIHGSTLRHLGYE